MKILTPFLHGVLDYVTVVIFLFAPSVLGLLGIAAMLSYLLAGFHLLMTLLTDVPLSAAKMVPFSLHGWVERIVGPVLVIVSFVPMVASSTTAMVFFLVMGIVIIAVGLLTDYSPHSMMSDMGTSV